MRGASLVRLEALHELGAQPLGICRRERTQHAAPMLGNVSRHSGLWAEDVMLEQRPPGGARRLRQRAQVEQMGLENYLANQTGGATD